MPILKCGNVISENNYSLDLFGAESGETLLESLLVESGSLVLLKVVKNDGMAYVFFRFGEESPIPLNERYTTENGQSFRQNIEGGFEAFIEIIVDAVTGMETISEVVEKAGSVVYQIVRERYVEVECKSLSYRLKEYVAQTNNMVDQEKKLIDRFHSSELELKVSILREIFRKEWRDRCQFGIDNPEYFLSKDMYGKLAEDSKFEEALLEVTKLEGPLIDFDSCDLYQKIVNYYNCSES